MRLTDGQTDRETEFSSLDRVCVACSAIKTIAFDGIGGSPIYEVVWGAS